MHYKIKILVALDIYNTLVNKHKIQKIHLTIIELFSPRLRLEICALVDTSSIWLEKWQNHFT